MEEIIILTNKIEDGQRLKNKLVALSSEYKGVPCFTKDTLSSCLYCRFIFSTWYMPVFTQEEIKSYFPFLECIFYAAGTVKYFAEPFLKNNVRIFTAGEANGKSVAEFTVGQILLANKGYFQAIRSFRWPIWSRGFRKIRHIAEKHSGNFNSVVGLLGCGSVGSKVAELLKAYNIKVLTSDPYLSEEKAKSFGVIKTDICTIFKECDVISNHLPNNSETTGIIDYTLLSLMKPYATFINTGRGAQVNEKDLVRIMRNRKDLTALLDVTSHEPPFPWSSLYHCKNIFMSPHIAGSINKELDRMYEFIYNSYIQFINGTDPEGEVFLSQLVNKA